MTQRTTSQNSVQSVPIGQSFWVGSCLQRPLQWLFVLRPNTFLEGSSVFRIYWPPCSILGFRLRISQAGNSYSECDALF